MSEAQRLEDKGEYELAIEKYKQSLDLGVGDPATIYERIGRHWARLGRQDESVLACQEAIRHNPELPIAHGVLGTIHYQRREFAQAEFELLEAVRLKPDYAAALVNLAHVYLASGRYQEASSIYEKAVILEPQNVETRIALARAYIAQEQPARALTEMGTALRRRPTSPQLYFLYLNMLLIGSLKSAGLRSVVTLGVAIGLWAIALLGPLRVSIAIGVLLSVLSALLVFVNLVVHRRKWRSVLLLFLSLGVCCAWYWLPVLGRSLYALGKWNISRDWLFSLGR
jgi:tetratricopeptide (TPR) repeat protein